MSTTTSRIRWTEVEKIALAKATQAYLRIYPGSRVMKAFKAALQVLPEDRRRNILAHAEIPWIDEYLVKVEADTDDTLFRDAHAQDINLEEAPTLRVVRSIPAQQDLPLEREREVKPPVTPPIDFNSVSLEELTKVWLNRFFNEHIAPQIEQKADELMAKKMAAMIEQIQIAQGEKGRVQVVVPMQVKRQLRPKVLVLGLLGNQITTIKERYSDRLDLTLIGSDHNHDGLIQLAKSHDIGVVMTRFVNHSQVNQVKNNAPHCIPVSGAITDLGNILTSIINEGMDKIKEHNYNQKTFAH
jgi:hypothetical protein